jgi:glycosyltransferase involved in cell wall biosynthesis
MTRPFRILMAMDLDFPPDIRVENEALTLIEAGFEVTVLAIAPDDRPAADEHRGIRIIRDRLSAQVRNKMRGLAATVPALSWYVGRRIQQIHRDWPFDAVHVHDLYMLGGGLRGGRALGLPVVGDLHENWVDALEQYAWSTRPPGKWVVRLPRWRRLEARWTKAADEIVVVIEEMGERLRKLGVPEERITVVPNTIRRADFDGFETEPALIAALRERPTLVYTGGMDLHRGLSSAIRAMPRILRAYPDAQLVLVGDGRTRAEHEAEAAALGLGDAVVFTGWQPQAKLKSYMLGSTLCVLPHLRSVQTDSVIPHKLFHYMYLQRPIVAADCTPIKRITERAGAGVVYEAGNPEALAEAALRILGDPEAAAAMAARGRAAVEERYHWEHTAQGLVQMYRRLERAGAR